MPDSQTLAAHDVLRLSPAATLKHDPVRGAEFLLLPERVVRLNDSAAAILRLFNGKCTLGELIDAMAANMPDQQRQTVENDIFEFVRDCLDKNWLTR